MFGLNDDCNYELRKIAKWQNNMCSCTVSTARVPDGNNPIETCIFDEDYNDGNGIVVESYADVQSALHGHNRWVEQMSSARKPTVLTDCKHVPMSDKLDCTIFERRMIYLGLTT